MCHVAVFLYLSVQSNVIYSPWILFHRCWPFCSSKVVFSPSSCIQVLMKKETYKHMLCKIYLYMLYTTVIVVELTGECRACSYKDLRWFNQLNKVCLKSSGKKKKNLNLQYTDQKRYKKKKILHACQLVGWWY